MFCKKNIAKNNKYILDVWDDINIFLSIATAFTTVIFVVLFILCFIISVNEDCYSIIIGMCGVFASLASAFFIAVFVRLFEMKKKKKQELNAINILKTYLVEIYTVIDNFLPQIQNFTAISENNMIEYSRERIYYKDEYNGRSYIDFDKVFKTAEKKLNSALNKALTSPIIYQCNENVVELVTKLQLNGFTRNLSETQSLSDTIDPMAITYGALFKNFAEFLELYTDLTELIEKKHTKKLTILTDEEKTSYIKEIESILPQLPPHNGTIYRGRDRIK